MKAKRKITAADLLEMTPVERIHLMQLLWDTLDEPDMAFELTDGQKAERGRHWKAHKRHPPSARNPGKK